jgi:hypothetical protein
LRKPICAFHDKEGQSQAGKTWPDAAHSKYRLQCQAEGLINQDEDMAYQFQTQNFGRCRLTYKTSGKHGFGLPKLFIIESIDQPTLGQVTFRYVDTAISGVHGAGLSNALL